VWNLGLGYFKDSAALGWPGRLRKITGLVDVRLFEPDLGIARLTFRAVTDLQTLKCQKVVLHSPAWQKKHAPALWKSTRPAVRFFTEGKADMYFGVAANYAFFGNDVSFLAKIAPCIPKYNGDASAEDEVELLFGMLKAAKPAWSNGKVMDVIKNIFRENDLDAWYSKEFLKLDEALGVMETPDVNMIHDDQKREQSRATSRKHFAVSYRRKVESLEKEGGKEEKAKPKKGPERVPVEAEIPQPVLASMMPPGGSVWQCRGKQSWACHVPPRPRFSEPWGDNCEAAAHTIAMRAWARYLQMIGKGWDSCPHQFGAEPDLMTFEL